MSIRTAFIDVDLTLIDTDNNLFPMVKEGLEWMTKVKGYKLVCWSAGGEEYAENILEQHEIRNYFAAVLDKPDFVIDDSPHSIVSTHNTVKVNNSLFWEDLKSYIFRKDTKPFSVEEEKVDLIGFQKEFEEEDDDHEYYT